MDLTDVLGDPAGYLSADALRAVGEAAGLNRAQLRRWLAEPLECRQAFWDAERFMLVHALDEAIEVHLKKNAQSVQ
jgi:hypothetical protein